MPLFKPELLDLIIADKKTQTRRPIKFGEKLIIRDGKKTVLTKGGRIKMQVGRDYAIPYAYGKPCRWWHPERHLLLNYQTYLDVLSIEGGISLEEMDFEKLRIIITDIHEEDVRTINYQDSLAEGFESAMGFFRVWCGFYDKTALSFLDMYQHHADFKDVLMMLNEQPSDKYQAFAYTFKIK